MNSRENLIKSHSFLSARGHLFFSFQPNTQNINALRAIDVVMAVGGLAVFAEEGEDVLGVFNDALFVAIVAVDEYDEVGGGEFHLGAFVVAGGCAYPTLCITIHRQTMDIDHASSDAFVGLALTANAQRQCVANKLIGIESANAVAVGNRSQIDEIDERIYLIERLALEHPSDECLRGRAIARGVLATGLIDTARGSDAAHLFQRLCGERLPVLLAQGIDLLPQRLTIRRIDDVCFHTSPNEGGTNLLYLL